MKILTADDNPFSRGTSIVDTRGAVLLDDIDVVALDNPSDGRTLYGLELQGRLNRSTTRSDVLYLMDVAGAATLVSELVGMFGRAGQGPATEFTAALDEAIAALPARGRG